MRCMRGVIVRRLVVGGMCEMGGGVCVCVKRVRVFSELLG